MSDHAAGTGGHVLVTGGSRGIGFALASQFAARGHGLVLVARDAARLRAAADALEARHGVPVFTYAADLASPAAPEQLRAALQAQSIAVSYLVNNAGRWSWRAVRAGELADLEDVVAVNVLAPLRLAKIFLPQIAAARGGILFVSSLSALIAGRGFATYSASKAFTASFARALREECRGEGVKCCVVLPGVVETDFVHAHDAPLWHRLVASAPETVARAAYLGLLSGQATVVPGVISRILYLGTKLLPTRVSQVIFNVATASSR